MNHIQLDPFASGSINEALNPIPSVSSSNSYSAPHSIPSMYNIQNMLQMYTMNKFMSNGTSSFLKTGNGDVDHLLGMVLQMMVLGSVTMLMTQLGTVIIYIKQTNNNIIRFVWGIILIIYRFFKQKMFRERKKYYRTVDIPYISDTRQINELYKAVFWFLTNDSEIDYLHEPYLQFVFDKKISVETREAVKRNLSIHKILSQQKSKKISFKNHDITYILSTELITVYTDKDRKRENYKVTLTAVIDEYEKTDVLDEFCQHCLVEYINNLTSSTWTQQIYTNSNGEWKSSPSNNTRKLDTIILKDGLKDEIKSDLQLFLNSEDWYKERDIPYSRGYLFYGYPGTGKTSMIKGMSMYCKRHIHFLMLSEVRSDGELIELLKKINYKETVLVIEDIDAMVDIVKDRESDNSSISSTSSTSSNNDSDDSSNDSSSFKKIGDKIIIMTGNGNQQPNQNGEQLQSQKSALTLSGLLNAIDGVFTCHGRILIMTTNHPEVLDAALIRPGRVDSKYLFSNCNKEQIRGLYEMFFNSSANEEQLKNIRNDEYSPAHITSVFLRYRNNYEEALEHLDDIETKVIIPKLFEVKKQ
jgi:AAA+ superfamily predicted ATPase